MPWLFVVIGALMVLFAVLVNARGWWRTTASWRYRNPDANEPSEAGFAAWRAGTAFAGVVLVVLGLWLNVTASGSITGKVDPRPAVELVAEKLGTSVESLVSLDRNGKPNVDRLDLHKDLDQAIYHHISDVNHREYRAADLAVDSSSQDSDIHRFTVDAAGDNRYCLAVRESGEPVLAGKPIYGAPSPGRGGMPPSPRPIMDTIVVPISTSVTDGACE